MLAFRQKYQNALSLVRPSVSPSPRLSSLGLSRRSSVLKEKQETPLKPKP